MFCKNCGTEIKEGAKFCAGCGSAAQPVNTPMVQTAEPVPQPVPAYSPAPAIPTAQYAMAASAPMYNQQSVVTASKSNKLGIAALILGILAFIGAGIFTIYMIVAGFSYHFDNIGASTTCYLLCLIGVGLGIASIYGKRTKQGLAGMIIVIAAITLLFIPHVVVGALIPW
jgi:hypothetical protein